MKSGILIAILIVTHTVLAAGDPKRLATLKVEGKPVFKNVLLQVQPTTAEVKPDNAIVNTYCGEIEEDAAAYSSICIAHTKKGAYILLTLKADGDLIFIRTSEKVSGPSLITYAGRGVELPTESESYTLEKYYELSVSIK